MEKGTRDWRRKDNTWEERKGEENAPTRRISWRSEGKLHWSRGREETLEETVAKMEYRSLNSYKLHVLYYAELSWNI